MANQMITINLPKKVKVKTYGNKDVEIDKIEVFEMVDSPMRKTVTAHCNNHPTKILVWEGAAYDSAGQWTEADLIEKIKALYSK